MAYIINKSNGEPLLTLEDGTLNSDYSVGLLGKNTIGYGEVQNENFIHLLEHFAAGAPPAGNILKGQVYFNTEANQLNVYDGSQWNLVGNAIVSDSTPTTTTSGAVWLKSTTQQLYVYNNGWQLVGPEALLGYGRTQAKAAVLIDTADIGHAVLEIFADGKIIAICSADLFTIKDSNAVEGFSIIKPGITLSTSYAVKGNLEGNALTATTLLTPRKINGVDFNGSSDITILAGSPSALKAGQYIVGDNYTGLSEVTWTIDATSGNVGNKVVVRDANGDFGARNITANIIGTLQGNVTTFDGLSQFNQVNAQKFLGPLEGEVTGNASSATKLRQARTINGVAFDGTTNITIAATTGQNLIPGQYIDGLNFNGSGQVTWAVKASSTNIPSYVVARDANGNFAASTITANLAGNVSGNVTATSGTSTFNNIVAAQVTSNVIGSVSGNAGTATKLQNARAINGVPFDGTANITISASTPATLQRGSYMIGLPFNGSETSTWSVDATQMNQPNKVVARDTNGDFSAGTISANLLGNVQGNVTGNHNGNTYGTHYGNVSGNTAGLHTGNVIGNVSGNVSGSASLNVLKTGDTMTGRLVVPAGYNGGLAFPNDPYGGGGDRASITLETKSGEATTLTIRVENDADDTVGIFAPTNNGLTMNNNVVWHAGNDGAGSGLDADLLDGMQPSTGGSSNIVARDGNGNFSANVITAIVSGHATNNVLKSGDTMSGYLTLVGNPVNPMHAATRQYVDAVAATGYSFTSGASYSTTGYTNQVGSFNYGANYFYVFPPAGKSMANLVAFIPSIHVVHFAGGVDGNDSLMCTYEYLGDRIRVRVQNTEQRSTPAANWLAVWR